MSSLGKVGGPYIRKDVLTARGDVIARDVNQPERVALGILGNMLFSDGTDSIWYSPCASVGEIPIHTGVGYQQALAAGAAGKFLRANGVGALPSYEDLPAPPVVKGSVYSPVTYVTGGVMGIDMRYPVAQLTNAGQACYMSLTVPTPFVEAGKSIKIWGIAKAGGNLDYIVHVNYAGIGENRAINSNNRTSNFAGNADAIFGLDITDLFTGLAAGDVMGIRYQQNAGGENVNILGAKLDYSLS